MNYIVLDLEWDSAYSVKHKRFINQILQIGAVKLDEKLKIVDTFEVTIRSSFAKKVSKRFELITGITTEKMLSGENLEDAVQKYNAWCGCDTVTMSWSTSDLFAIIENEKNFLEHTRFNIEKYIDLQKFVQNEMQLLGHEINSQISLSDAATLLGVSINGYELHTAKDDSLLCVALLNKTYNATRFDSLIRDTRNPEFYRRLCFKPFYLNDLSDPLINRSDLKFKCEHCGEKMRRQTKWRYKNRWFCSDFKCPYCNKTYSCRVSFKKNYDDVAVKKRCVEATETIKTEVKNEVQSLPTLVQ